MAIVFDWWVTDLLALIVTTFLILYVTFRINYTYWKKKGLPYLEPTFPMGNTWGTTLLKRSPGEEAWDLYNETEGRDVVGIYSLNNPVLLVRGPELIKTILVKDFNYFPDRGIYVDEKKDHLSAHLFLLGGSKWKSLRTKLSPTFTSGKMRAMFNIVRDCGGILAEVMPVSDDVEMRELIARYNTDVIASCAFGIDVDCQHNPEAKFRQMGKRFFEPSVRTFLTMGLAFSNPKIRSLLPVPFTPRDVTEYFTRAVTETIEHREKAEILRKDFMQLLIQLKNKGYVDDSFSISGANGVEKNNKILTIEEIAAQAWVFFLAGFETSSTTTSFCLYELAKNQDIQKRLQDEIDEVLKKNNGEITYELIMNQLPYLEKVVSETLRKYPAVPVLNRELIKDYKLPGYDCVLDKGTKVLIPVMGLHNDTKYFQNPEKFDPEHFSEEQKASRQPFSYLPFGEGPRICIGMRFGQMQVKVALVNLLSRFQFLPSASTKDKLRLLPYVLVPTPEDGIRLRIKRRQVAA